MVIFGAKKIKNRYFWRLKKWKTVVLIALKNPLFLAAKTVKTVILGLNTVILGAKKRKTVIFGALTFKKSLSYSFVGTKLKVV